MDLRNEAREYASRKQALARHAAQRVALLCNCGIDVDGLAAIDTAKRAAFVRRLRRLLERERIRGGNRHWSYDLNRHIALKQALDDLSGSRDGAGSGTNPAPRR